MSAFLNTLGMDRLAIAICDRCKRKRPWVKLGPDPNYPGLRVCQDHDGCKDEYDPYRLPARKTEDISMPWARPDVPVTDE